MPLCLRSSELEACSQALDAGGLDLAALELFPGSAIAWHSEVDPAASKVLAYHFPGVPNLGDITGIDWSVLEPVDAIVGGPPCQDVSAAGKRAGLSEGTRSGLWSHMATAIDVLRPRYVLIENVRGLLSAKAIRGVEPTADAVADIGSRPVLRALGAVLGDLADVGFDAEWTCLSASTVGACHRRERVFVLAFPSDSAGPRPQGQGAATDANQAAPAGQRLAPGRGSQTPTLLPTPSVADGTGGHRSRSGERASELLLPGVAVASVSGGLMPTPRASDGAKGGPNQRGSAGGLMLPSAAVRWGDYADAINRQERLSRPAPLPTEAAPRGGIRLSPAFAEWLMFWPAGWVTEPSIGLSRIDQLRVIGNGVVPPQAVAAFSRLFASAAAPIEGAAS